ncbi:hypothetical protein MMC31_006643 [Peltigera leucophlebia]|nr:hypothetical protein [Peltigera leucophlebia]
MMLLRFFPSLALVFASLAVATGSHRYPIKLQLDARDEECENNFSLCSPTGAASIDTPAVGTGLSALYLNLVDSIQGVQNHKRAVDLDHQIDRFTTNFLLPGGATGTIVTGNYTSPNGDAANLQSGTYTLADGTAGNIYGSTPNSLSLKPDTATLSLPTQFTAAGVGTAIPLTALGKVVTYTTVIPGTTVVPLTVPALTQVPSVVDGATVVPGTTKPATVIPGTTIPAKTSTVTSTIGGATSASTSDGAPSPGRITTFIMAGITLLLSTICRP